MREAVIVSTARTGLAKSYRGGFNNTHGAAMSGHAVKHAIARAKIAPEEVEDVIMGCGLPEGATGQNVGRLAAIWAGCPVTTSGVTVSRFCSSGLQAIAVAAGRVLNEGVPIAVGAGVESISLVQGSLNTNRITEEKLMQTYPALWMPMIDTADIVAARYNISRERQDRFSLESQKRTAAAQQANKFADEIVPMETVMTTVNKETGESKNVAYTVTKDECNRPDTTYEALASLKPVKGPDKFVTAGNASQLSDGASACVVMEAKEAAKRDLKPLGIFKGFAVAGLRARRNGHRPRLRRTSSYCSVTI